ncbi:MAG: HEAT repeat domain-containing protein [Planctomycetota bacterium]
MLLAQGPAGLGLLRGRLTREMPSDAIAPLLRAVDELAPESLGISDLVALLDHPQSAMRSTVERLLADRVTSADMPVLVRALSAERTDTRLRVLDLVGRLPGRETVDLLFARLDDSKPQVAQRCAELLALREEPEVQARLVETAFSTQLLFRVQSYALLSLVAREDQRGVEIVGPDRVDMLVRNLSSAEPFSRGAAAVALAGIGYRSDAQEDPEWFRLRVPHELVAILSGGTKYHKDFAALKEPALRRLERISGRNFGSDGPAWQSWWVASATEFAPRRAALPGGSLAVATVRVEWTALDGTVVALAADGARVPAPDGTFYLDEIDAAEASSACSTPRVCSLRAACRAAGCRRSKERFTVAVGGAEKSFEFARGLRPTWADPIRAEITDLEGANDWQQLVDPQMPGARRGLFRSEASWWREARAVPGTEGAKRRAVRRKELALAALLTTDPGRRGPVLEDLLDAYRVPGVLAPDDAGALLGIVETEPYHSQRTATLVQLLVEAGSTGGDGRLDADFGRDLFDRLYERYRGGALESLARVTEAVGVDFARELSRDPRSLARALSTTLLARSEDEEDTKRLESLLSDGEVELVQEAAIAAIGSEHREDLRHLVLARAELAPSRVRQAAITALGELGGPGALDAMVVCFADGDTELRRTALRALGRLDDPHAAEIVVQMVSRGPSDDLFETARDTALARGERARLPLVDLAVNERSPGHAEAAFLLAEIGAAEAVPALLGLLANTGADADRAADELAVLSCLDLRSREDRGLAWRAWWEGAAQRDPLVWLREAQRREGLPVAPPGSLEKGGTIDGALALAATVQAPAGVVSERARRELTRLLGETVQPPPASGDVAAWRAALDSAIERRYRN